MKKKLTLLMALLLTLASCSTATTGGEETTPTASPTTPDPAVTEETEDPDARIDSGLEPADFEGYQFHIFIHNTITNDFAAEEMTGQPAHGDRRAIDDCSKPDHPMSSLFHPVRRAR